MESSVPYTDPTSDQAPYKPNSMQLQFFFFYQKRLQIVNIQILNKFKFLTLPWKLLLVRVMWKDVQGFRLYKAFGQAVITFELQDLGLVWKNVGRRDTDNTKVQSVIKSPSSS